MTRRWRSPLALALVLMLGAGLFTAARLPDRNARMTVVAYFESTTGLFAGDHVWIRGVSVGKVEKIEPQPEQAKVTFSIDSKYRVPADAKAV
ncbi:MlaD family protein, partial [Mycolicibacterium elephantis]